MTAPEAASRARLLGKGERGETTWIGERSVRRRHSAPSRALRAWIPAAGALYGTVGHEAWVAPTAWDEESWTRPFVAGPPLAERGGIEWREACRAFVPAAQALASLHSCGLFHGHVHPGNLLFRGESLVLADGGWSTRVTRVGGRELPGTLGHLAPEVLLERPIEPRSDLYALGACLFFALTRLLPWDAPTRDALFRMHLRGQVRRLRSLVADAPADLERLIVAMLAPSPSDRPWNAREVAVTLSRLAGEAAPVDDRLGGPLRPPLVGRTNDLRALRLALVDTCLRSNDDAQGPLLLPGPKRIEREERADSLEGLVGEASISATALSARQPMQAVVVSEAAAPGRPLSGPGVPLRPMNGGVLLIAGEEGTGKTRLVEEAGAFALGEGVEFVFGHCPQRPMRPLDPFAEVLSTLLAREPWEGPIGALPPLAMPIESAELPKGFAALEAARRANFDAVARFLVDRARRAPLAICVEDLHYADGSVCSMLLTLVRALRVALHEGGGAEGRPEARADLPRLFLAATYDPTAGAPRAEELLKELRDIDAVQVIATLPLAAPDRATLFRALLPEAEAASAQAEAARRGAEKPLHVCAMARRMPRENTADLWKDCQGELDAEAAEAVGRAAAFARPANAHEIDPAACLRARGLLDVALTLDGPVFAPWHDWAQRMAWREGGERRRALHAACAAAARSELEREWHRMKGGIATEEDSRAAMRCLALGDWELAETLLEALRQALGGKLTAEKTGWLARAEVLSGYDYQAASLLEDSGHLDAETTALLRAIQARGCDPGEGVPESEASCECARSEALLWEGRPAEAAEAALSALRLARERGPVESLPGVFLQMGRLYRFAAQLGAAVHCLRRAARMWRDGGRREEYARAVAWLAEAFRAAGSAESAAKAQEEARAASPKIEDPILCALARIEAGEVGDDMPLPPVLAHRMDRIRAGRSASERAAARRAAEGAIAERAEAAGDIEGAWLAHDWLATALAGGEGAEAHRRRAAELVMAAYAALPEELKRGFLEDPVRRRIVEA